MVSLDQGEDPLGVTLGEKGRVLRERLGKEGVYLFISLASSLQHLQTENVQRQEAHGETRH